MAITQADIENVYGANFVAQWSSFVQGTTVPSNMNRITQAIAWGEAQVNNKLRNGPYVVPITPTDGSDELPEILDAKATLAGWWLWKTRGLNQAKETVIWMQDHYKRIMTQLYAIRNGSYPLPAVYNTRRTNVPFSI